jgi:hypothetical protein
MWKLRGMFKQFRFVFFFPLRTVSRELLLGCIQGCYWFCFGIASVHTPRLGFSSGKVQRNYTSTNCMLELCIGDWRLSCLGRITSHCFLLTG